jgi:hypothetical protein
MQYFLATTEGPVAHTPFEVDNRQPPTAPADCDCSLPRLKIYKMCPTNTGAFKWKVQRVPPHEVQLFGLRAPQTRQERFCSRCFL